MNVTFGNSGGGGITQADADARYLLVEGTAQTISNANAATARAHLHLTDETGGIAVIDSAGTTQHVPKFDTLP